MPASPTVHGSLLSMGPMSLPGSPKALLSTKSVETLATSQFTSRLSASRERQGLRPSQDFKDGRYSTPEPVPVSVMIQDLDEMIASLNSRKRAVAREARSYPEDYCSLTDEPIDREPDLLSYSTKLNWNDVHAWVQHS